MTTNLNRNSIPTSDAWLPTEDGFSLFPWIERFIRDNQAPLVFLIAVAFVFYGYELFNLNLSIDQETDGVSGDRRFWIETGRWGMYLVNQFITTYTTIPVLPLAMALILCALATMIIFRLFDQGTGYGIYLFPALALLFPSLPYILIFSLNAAGIGVGMLCAAVGVHLLEDNKLHRKIYATLLLAFSIGIYQSFLLLIASIIALNHLHLTIRSLQDNLKHNKSALVENAKNFINSYLYLTAAILVYLAINKLFLSVANLQMYYVTNFINVDVLLHHTHDVLTNFAHQLASAYFGYVGIYIDSVPLVPVLSLLSVLSLCKFIFSVTKSYIIPILIVVLIVLCLLLPFAFNLLNGGNMPFRSLLALPMVITIIWWMGYRYSTSILIKKFFVVGGMLLIIQFAIINNRHFDAIGIALDNDKNIAALLVYKIHQNIAVHGMPSCIEFVGYNGYPANEFLVKSEVFGASFFEWDQGNPIRIIGFLRMMGVNTSLQLCRIEQRQHLVAAAQKMPAWPNDGAVDLVSNILVVKFSDYSPAQLLAICNSSTISGCKPK